MVTRLAGVSLAWRRPRAWVLLYGLVSVPAALLASVWTLAFLPLARWPFFAEALATQRLDWVLDSLTGQMLAAMTGTPAPETGLPILGSLVAICGALLIWPLFGIVWVALEGGTLASYAAPTPLSWREFGAACKRWFGPFVLLNSAGVVVAALLLGVAWGVASALHGSLPLTAQVVRNLGWLAAGAVASLVELARVVGVAQGTRHVGAMLRGAWQTLMQHPVEVLALLLAGLALYGLLDVAYRALMGVLPFRWWLLTLLVQQLYVALRLGVRLAREAGLVGMVVGSSDRQIIGSSNRQIVV